MPPLDALLIPVPLAARRSPLRSAHPHYATRHCPSRGLRASACGVPCTGCAQRARDVPSRRLHAPARLTGGMGLTPYTPCQSHLRCNRRAVTPRAIRTSRSRHAACDRRGKPRAGQWRPAPCPSASLRGDRRAASGTGPRHALLAADPDRSAFLSSSSACSSLSAPSCGRW